MNEADRRRGVEIDIGARVERLEEYRDEGAIAKNAKAMKQTIEAWNGMYADLDRRVVAMENNLATILRLVRQLENSNTLALQQLRGAGPTA